MCKMERVYMFVIKFYGGGVGEYWASSNSFGSVNVCQKILGGKYRASNNSSRLVKFSSGLVHFFSFLQTCLKKTLDKIKLNNTVKLEI